jgi:hypothetical protein
MGIPPCHLAPSDEGSRLERAIVGEAGERRKRQIGWLLHGEFLAEEFVNCLR